MARNLRQSILRSLGRYIAIAAIIALGAGIFVGLLATKTDMVATGQYYMDQQNMFDLRLLNPYGWTQRELDAIGELDGIEKAEGAVIMDVIGRMGDADEDSVYQLYTIPDTVNKVYLRGGRMPEAPNECLADSLHVSDAILGKTFHIADNNESSTLEGLHYTEYTVVGYVSSPLFMDLTRGNTTLGNGSVSAFVYLPKDAFNVDYFTEIAVTIPGEYEIYSDAYNDALDAAAEQLEPLLQPLAQQRYEQVRADAQQQYDEGMAEYLDGIDAYEQAKKDAESELESARLELEDAQAEIETNRKKLSDGEKQLDDGKKLLADNEKTLSNSRWELEEAKSQTYAQLAQAEEELSRNQEAALKGKEELAAGLEQIRDGLTQVNTGIIQLEFAVQQLDLGIGLTDARISALDADIRRTEEALENAKQSSFVIDAVVEGLEQRLQEQNSRRDEYVQENLAQKNTRDEYALQLTEVRQQRDQLIAQRSELEQTDKELDEALSAIDAGFLELQEAEKQAEAEFAEAEEQLTSAQIQLNEAKSELAEKERELEEGKTALAAGSQQLADGLNEYNEGKTTAEKELNDAKAELDNAKLKLDDAKETIDSMEAPEVYVLDRNTNVGYLAVDNNSDIVAGVSRVFPAFFLLVAALVCITTMTRMVEEERTQIGTLKALGYGNGAIISKYLIYAGSAAVIGCGFGVFAGSIIFPKIIWIAYSLILTLTPDIQIVFNVPLCVCVVAAYVAVILGVTWYCCRISLREVPAELIRPKAPTSGKKIILEYLPFWERFSFLNKVMLRNIFRYRQRLLMMLVGIGGCTALLLTGFGIGDSIQNVVSYQFEEVTLFDIQVMFSQEVSSDEQTAFCDEFAEDTQHIGFVHQSSVDLDFDNAVKNVSLIASDATLENFFDFHSGRQQLAMPEKNAALVSVGVAEAMGIKVGDTVTLRNTDLETLQVTVSGIFDNNVQNYVIVTPETLQEQLGRRVQYQVAYLLLPDSTDAHALSAQISTKSNVMNVMISQDLADQVSSMLEAMDMIVATIVVCASLLAVIVLYNLTNINITERMREIATIKVLGFKAGESAMYVFKENLVLSGMGAVTGLLGGKLLLDFVMDQIKIDMVWFQSRIIPESIIWSVVITMLMACLVDFVLYFRLDKINMAEALKSVE